MATTLKSARRRRTERRRGAGQRGAVLIEFAFVVGPLLLLVFGTIDFGWAFNDHQALRAGVRDAARSAAVAEYGSTTDCGLAGVTTTDVNTRELLCATKAAVGLGDDTRVKVLLGDDGYQRGAPLVLCAQLPLRSVTGMFTEVLDGRVLSARVEMRIEKTTAELVVSAEEQPLPGNDWSACRPADAVETPTASASGDA